MDVEFDLYGRCAFTKDGEQCAFNTMIHGVNYHLIGNERIYEGQE